MDCAKLIAFGSYQKEDLWDYIKGRKNPYGLEKLPLILIPTYPSSGSEYGLGAVGLLMELREMLLYWFLSIHFL